MSLTTKIHVFYHQLSDTMLQASLEQIIAQLPDNMQDRASRYKSKRTALNFLQGRKLLAHGLEYLGRQVDLSSMTYLPSGKPIIEGVEFNISHSHNIAVCAFSSHGAIGVDIEYFSELHVPHLKQNFTEDEWDAIQTDTSYPELFFKLWTRKESIIKASGSTLADLHKVHLNSLDSHVQLQGQVWHLQELSLHDNTFAALCTSCPANSIEYIPCPIDLV